MLTFNEGKVCDAIVRRLEEREQHARADLRWPEHEEHESPVEVAFTLGGQLYALEHTGIEPFEGHVRMEAQTEKLFAPITNALKDSLGVDALFELYLPLNALDGWKPAELQTIQNAIIEWVKATAPTISKRPHPDFKGTRVGPSKLPNVRFELSLCRFEPPIIPGQHFQIRHIRTFDVLGSAPVSKPQPAWKSTPAVLAGRRVEKRERPGFLQREVAGNPNLTDRDLRMLSLLIEKEGQRGIFVKHATLAASAGCGITAVKESLRRCQHFGYQRWSRLSAQKFRFAK
jgi:hypothetical protein